MYVWKLPGRIDFWRPMAFTKDELRGAFGNMDFLVIARLASGAGAAQALAELKAIERQIIASFPEPMEVVPVLGPMHNMIVSRSRRPLWLLLGAVGFVLLIGSINLANLMLVRAHRSRRELAIRSALGARPGSLMRRLLVESCALALAGGALGVLVARWLIDLAVWRAPVELPRIEEVSLDWVALGFAFGISLITGLLFGVLPGWRAARTNPQEALRSFSRGATDGPGGGIVRNLLVAAEVAVSVVLLLGAGLLLRSLVRILQVDRGFEERNLIAADLSLPGSKYRDRAQRLKFYREVDERVRALAGVRRAGLVSSLPVTQETWVNLVSAGDRPAPPLVEWAIVNFRSASPDYFPALGIGLRAGRLFAETDGENRVVLISQTLADRLWLRQDPIGQTLRLYQETQHPRVVGVVGAVHLASLTQEPGMVVYFPHWQQPRRDMSVVARTVGDPSRSAAAIRRAVWSVDRDIAIPQMRTMAEVVSESVAGQRFQAFLLLAFALIALLLASLGIYGVVAYTVSQRTNEIGIRMALGARPGTVGRLVIGQAARPVAAGLAVGLVTAMGTGRVIQSLLYGVSPLDPVTYAAVAALLAVVALAACLAPAGRAARVDPVTALRYE